MFVRTGGGLFPDALSVKPILRLTVMPGEVRVAFNKQGAYGITIFSRQKGSNDWIELVSLVKSPHIDKRALTEPDKPETSTWQGATMA